MRKVKSKYRVTYGGMMLGNAEKKAITRIVNKNYWPLGEEGTKMEQEACKFLGMKYGVLAHSGTSAGLLALLSLELPAGSEVIIPAVTFPTIFNIIPFCGLVPVVVDSRVGDYNLDPSELEKAISPKTKAIIAVHAVGNPCDMPAIMAIAKKYGIYVLEDNCDGWGGLLKGQKVGTFADVSFTSFHAAHIVSMGQGGGIFTNNATIARNARMYRDWGRQSDIDRRTNDGKWPELPDDYDSRFIYEKMGLNLAPLELQAAMGREQLKITKKIRLMRKKNFHYLYNHLKKHKDLIMPTWVEGADPSWFAMGLSTYGERGPLIAHLEANGIETRSMFAGNITRHPAYKNAKYRISGKLESADFILRHSFWIGVHPRMTQADREFVVKVFDDYYA